MRNLTFIPVLVILAGCMTPEHRALQEEKNIDAMIAVYGRACDKLGFHRDTDAWRNCVLQLNASNEIHQYTRSPMILTCSGHWRFSQCAAF